MKLLWKGINKYYLENFDPMKIVKMEKKTVCVRLELHLLTSLETEEKSSLICWAGSCKKEKMSTNDPV